MINFNGRLIPTSQFHLNYDNRGLKFGDGVFDTLKIINGNISFLEAHYFRLMASMRMLRMEIPSYFTLEYYQNQILTLAEENSAIDLSRVRFTAYRKSGGLYTPITNEIDFLIEVTNLDTIEGFSEYEVDLYKDLYNYSGRLSTIKTTNKMLNILAGIYASENDLNTCLLLNERKSVVESIQGNIFLVFDNKVVTSSLEEGCIKGVIRTKLLELLNRSLKYTIEERAISPFELQKADELFVTNSVIDIQPVTKYRKKQYSTSISLELLQELKKLPGY